MSADQPDLMQAPGRPAPTVLVVDDDPEITDVIRAALEDAGYRVLTALGGAALQLAHERVPSLILLDVMMPEMDGVEMSQRLRADPSTARIPIIAMSAQGRLQVASAVMPVNDRLPKPFKLPDLYLVVERWIGQA
jgi:CheY-like chemotaxis protein